MASGEHTLQVENRLTRLETTLDAIAEEVKQTTAAVGQLASLAQGDRRLVKGFILALSALWAIAQFVTPMLKDDGQKEVVTLLREIKEGDKRIKSLEEIVKALPAVTR